MTAPQPALDDGIAGSWVALNGYGILIGLLELAVAIFYLLDPTGPHLIAHVAHVGIGLAGAGLLASYAWRRVDIEVYASILLAISNLAKFAINVFTNDPPSFETQAAILQLIIIFAVTLRVRALLQGGVYAIPRWRNPKDAR